MGDYINNPNYAPPYALLRILDYQNQNALYSQDRNPVYVNGDYIGNVRNMQYRGTVFKSLDDFLKSRSLCNYVITTDGYEVYIDTRDKNMAEHIKNNLEVYLNIN